MSFTCSASLKLKWFVWIPVHVSACQHNDIPSDNIYFGLIFIPYFQTVQAGIATLLLLQDGKSTVEQAVFAGL